MKVILLGPPGAGKGTQAKVICSKFNIVQISTGDMLRNAITNKDKLGLIAQETMQQGKLVADDIIIALVKNRINNDDCKNGFLFDGFPRTIEQAQALLQHNISIDLVIEIIVPDKDIIERISGRLTHTGSGRIYHKKFNPSKITGIDDITQEKLICRSDDNEDTIKARLKVYHQQTAPLIKFYNNNQYIVIDGTKGINAVSRDILTKLDNLKLN